MLPLLSTVDAKRETVTSCSGGQRAARAPRLYCVCVCMSVVCKCPIFCSQLRLMKSFTENLKYLWCTLGRLHHKEFVHLKKGSKKVPSLSPGRMENADRLYFL